MLTPMSDTPKIVERLLKKGLVNKEVDHTDRRLVAVTITPKGREMVQQLEKRALSVWDNLPGFSTEESLHLSILLDKLKASIKKLDLKESN
jgi:DNA-binding MarR family transcriptional regulator